MAPSKSRVTRAGRTLQAYINGEDISETALDDALRVAVEWRSLHSRPLALVTPELRSLVESTTSGADVAQRLKRMPQILLKLDRFPTMRLPQMSDIAGCRAVLLNTEEVEAVADHIRTSWAVASEADYREEGKPGTGYRALHLIVVRNRYEVEIQRRTRRQHRWAEVIESSSDLYVMLRGARETEFLASCWRP